MHASRLGLIMYDLGYPTGQANLNTDVHLKTVMNLCSFTYTLILPLL